MGELQCTVEISVELHKFINVDLFQRGFYQIRCTLKTSPKIPVKIEVNLPKNSSCILVFPACIINGTAASKTFQILYKNEEVVLDDTIIFKVYALVEGNRVRESLLKAGFQVIVELWFTDQSFGPDQHNSIHCVSSRTLLLHFDPASGLHHHVPLFFDYFHLCAVTITIHASLIAICQPYLNLQKPQKQSFLTGSPRLLNKKSHSNMETVFFGPQVGRSIPSSRLYRAHLIHWELESLLLSAYNCLCKKLMGYVTLLPPWQQINLHSVTNFSCFENLSDFAKECHEHVKSGLVPSEEQLFGPHKGMSTEDEILIVADSDIAQTCGALIMLWEKFLEMVIGREKIRQHLSRERHFQRVKRFSEAFFVIQRNRESALAPCDSSIDAYQEVSDCLRKSTYWNLLPPLEVECIEYDGDLNSLPIVYEEHYQEMVHFDSTNSQSSHSNSTVSLTDVNFLVNENANESTDVNRRTSQGSLGQKYRSPDISATPTSPSAYSWCPESISSPAFFKSSCLLPKKQTLKEKILLNTKEDNEWANCISNSNPFCRTSHKILVGSKLKVRSRTANFLRHLRKPHISSNPNTVVLLGMKKIDSCHTVACGIVKSSKMPFHFERGIRHSQSTLSVLSTLFVEGNSPICNSESMPDLTSNYILPQPALFLKSQIPNRNLECVLSDTLTKGSKKVPISPSYSSYFATHQRENQNKKCSQDNNVKLDRLCLADSESESKFTHFKYDTVFEKGSNMIKSSKDATKRDILDRNCQKYTKSLSIKHLDITILNQPTESEVKHFFNDIEIKKNKVVPPLSTLVDSTHLDTLTETKSNSDVCGVCPPSPPVQFKDPPSTDKQLKSASSKHVKVKEKNALETCTKSNMSWADDTCFSSIICQGTLFFPKPPAEFGDDVIETQETIQKPKISRLKNITKLEKPVNSFKEQTACKKVESSTQDDSEKDLEKNTSSFDTKCTVSELLKEILEINQSSSNENTSYITCNERQMSHSPVTANSTEEDTNSIQSASVIGTISFVKAKEEFRKHLKYPWLWYSDIPKLASDVPYFQCDSDLRAFSPEGMHLVICVHGLDGNSGDLRLVRTYLELGLPTVNFEFLMSERNQGKTFDDLETMTSRLVSEISSYIKIYGLKPVKISFIGHSLGNIIIRSALTKPAMKPYLSKLHTFLSLSGPHLGTLYNNSGLVNMGMWFMQKFKKSGSLLQLSMKDASDLRETFLYKLSQNSGLEYFHNILLIGSAQDRYVPLHSARIEFCKPALKDTSLQGMVYREMVTNLMQPIIQNPDIVLLRYDVHHALPSSANSLIGRAAHIAVVDSELFIEKFLAVCGLRFFV